MKVIGIAGPMGSGKTTMGQIIAKMFHGPVHHLPFSTPLKQMAYSMGWNGKKDAKGRRLLQLLGTDCGRNCIDYDIWIKKWIDQIKWCENQNRLIVVDDVRFFNEVQTIARYQGFLIKMTGRGEYSEHGSEQELHDMHFHLRPKNDSTIDLLACELKTGETAKGLRNFLNATTP